MGETEESKRLQSSLETSKGNFSEITAVSQRAINKAMAEMVKTHDEMAHVNISLDGIGSLIATISQPQISLKVTGASRADAEYFCEFSSGTLQFKQGDDKEPIDVSKWIIAFDVHIDEVSIDQGSDEDKRVRSAINQPGDYSISSLFLTFNDGDIIDFNFDHSDFQGYDIDTKQRIYLGALLADWYVVSEDGVMQDREKRTIAYGLHTTKPQTVNEQAPSFPPTALKFQTYEYIAPGASKPDEGIGKGDNNMLIYLQMTDGKTFPNLAVLEYSGNYVSRDMDGTMCIERDIFWNRYLLRRSAPQLLHIFNQYTYAWIESADVSWAEWPAWTIGMGDPSHSSDPEFYLWKDSPNNPLEWTWAPNKAEQHYSKKGEDGGAGCQLEITCTVENKLKAQAGSNVINASGTTDIKISCSAWSRITSAWWDYTYEIHVWVKWSTDITLSPVKDGGLQISLNLPSDLTNAFPVESDKPKHTGSAGFGNIDEKVFEKMDSLKDGVVDKFKKVSFGEQELSLQNDLQSTSRFVVPGNGVFIYKSPVFNNAGDLMIEVSYDETA